MKAKRYISAVLSLLIIVTAMLPCFSAINNYIQQRDAITFSSRVAELNKKYNTVTAENLINPDGSRNFAANENRLIVKSDCKINGTNEIDSVYGCGYAILQYNDEAVMKADRKMLSSYGYTVGDDKVLCVNDISDNDITVKYAVGGTYHYSLVGADYAQDFIENSGKEYDEIVVGVLDSGVNYNHELLADRITDTNLNFSSTGAKNDCMDDQGHGTLVSGIIVQSTPDNVKIKPYKVANSSGGATESELLSALQYIQQEKNKPDILNMSLGGYDMLEEGMYILRDEVQKLVDCGITVCVSAGNEGVPSDYIIPGGIEDVITVSSFGDDGAFSDFSDYGKMIDVCAPGENIYSSTMDGDYSSQYSGTSFSCPFTAAACTYILMQHPDYTPSQVQEKIKSSAVYQGEDDSYYYGSGILSFSNLIDDKPYEAPKPSVEGGLYHEAQTITFDVPEGTELIYSTSRLAPSLNNSTVYSSPIVVESDTVLHYALKKDGRYVSPIESAEYIIQYYASKSDFSVVFGMLKSYNGDKTNIVVPDNISATSVYNSAFKGSNITSIVLPDKITTLGTSAFQDSSLKHITAKGVKKFSGENVFYNCKDLRNEEMPNLTTVTESAFYGCGKLRTIDFGENITKLKTSLFEESGLLYGNFPNAQITSSSNENVFKGSNLFTCNIPKIEEIGVNFFFGCSYLYDLEMLPIKTLMSKGLFGCYYLKYLDFSNLEKLYSGGLSGTAVKYFYAPKIKTFADSGTLLGEFCNCTTVDLPNFTDELKSGFLLRSLIRELRLEKVTTVDSGAFKNTPMLKRIYLPNATQYCSPSVVTSAIDNAYNSIGIYFNKYPTQEIVWIPKATSLPSIINVEGVSLFYAPSATSVSVKIGDSDNGSAFVLSDVAISENVTFASSNTDGFKITTKVIASADSPLNTTESTYNFVPIDDVKYLDFENSDFRYSADNTEFPIPNDYIRGFWSTYEINKIRNQSQYSFILDFSNDGIINSKDYSVYLKNINS